MRVAGYEVRRNGKNIKIGCKTIPKTAIRKILQAIEEDRDEVVKFGIKKKCDCGDGDCYSSYPKLLAYRASKKRVFLGEEDYVTTKENIGKGFRYHYMAKRSNFKQLEELV